MALSLGQGFRPYLLSNLDAIAKENNPQYRLEPLGLINLLQSNDKPEVLRLNTPNGHKKSVQVKAKQRFNKSQTQTSKSCDNTNVPTFYEAPVDLSSTRQLAFYVADETIAKYMDEASRTTAVGQPATPLMNEFIEDIMSAASAILEGVNDDLFTLAVAAIGKNRVTGSAASTSINLARTITDNPLNDGETRILSDYKINGGKGRPMVVGSGLMYQYMLQQIAKSPNNAGIDTRIFANAMTFFHDLSAPTNLGSNQIIVYQPNAIQMVEYMEYTGFKAGPKPGASIFGTLSLPMGMGDEVLPVEFDWQLRYSDCATTMTDAYYGTTLTLQKGYNFILSKQCGLFAIPSQAYRATDVLNGNRGSLRYTITNV